MEVREVRDPERTFAGGHGTQSTGAIRTSTARARDDGETNLRPRQRTPSGVCPRHRRGSRLADETTVRGRRPTLSWCPSRPRKHPVPGISRPRPASIRRRRLARARADPTYGSVGIRRAAPVFASSRTRRRVTARSRPTPTSRSRTSTSRPSSCSSHSYLRELEFYELPGALPGRLRQALLPARHRAGWPQRYRLRIASCPPRPLRRPPRADGEPIGDVYLSAQRS